MGKVGDAKKQVGGYLSAVRTMLNNYPQPQVPEEMNRLLNANSPFAFVMELLRICGVTSDKLLGWVSKILCGQDVIKSQLDSMGKSYKNNASWDFSASEGYGFMDAVEEAFKVLLLMNVKNMFTCTLNPFIPDEVMKDPTGIKMPNPGTGIKIPLNVIDLYNVLSNSPSKNTGTFGSNLYFDNDYSATEMWKSTDLNAFLWYTIHRGTNSVEGEKKQIWDNRCRRWRALIKDKATTEKFLNKNFFNSEFGEKSFISKTGDNVEYGGYPNRPPRKTTTSDENDNTTKSKPFKNARKDDNKIKKLQYFIVNYNERGVGSGVDSNNYLTIWLNADRYKIVAGDGKDDIIDRFQYNKTVFEFNYDFIQHIRLFDTKVIVMNVINALMGITNSAAAAIVGGNFSFNQRMIAGKIGQIVKDVINNDTTISECSFNFSNDQYEKLLEETQDKHYNQEDIENIVSSVGDISNSATMEEAQTKIASVLENVAITKGKNDEGWVDISFLDNSNILIKLIEECMVQMIMQVLGPKVMLVFAINAYFMGDLHDNKTVDIASFLNGLLNLISTMVKQLYDLIMKELINFLMDEIRPLINLMIEKLLLERIRFYIDLLKRLLALIKMFYNAFKGNNPKSVIDNVNYADIIPKAETPDQTTC